MSSKTYFKYCLLQEAFPDLLQSPTPPRAGLHVASLHSSNIFSLLLSFSSLEQMNIYLGNLLKHFITGGASNPKKIVMSTLDFELLKSKNCLHFILQSFSQYLVTTGNCLLACYVVGYCPKSSICYCIYNSSGRKVCVTPILQIRQLRHRETK